jgi:hypothetical protein
VITFSSYNREFASFGQACVTLFALMNGDAILQLFDALNDNYPYQWVTWLYLYTFLTLFITAILNVFIFIIDDAYTLSKTINNPRIGEPGALVEDFSMKTILDIIELAPKSTPPTIVSTDAGSSEPLLHTPIND